VEIKASRHGEAAVLEIAGLLDTAASRDFDQAVQKALADGARHVAVDLAGAELLTSACIRILVTLHKRLRATGGLLLLCALNDHVQEVFEVAGIAMHFQVVPTSADALRRFAEQGAPAAVAPQQPSELARRVIARLVQTESAPRSRVPVLGVGARTSPSPLSAHVSRRLRP
jgi:anti-anti-sigma factor